MNSVVRYDARQGSFSATQKLVDLEIPANTGVVDLSKTYIAMDISLLHTGGDAATTIGGDTTNGTFNSSIQFCETNTATNFAAGTVQGGSRNGGVNNTLAPPTLAVMVKNASLMSGKKGRISDIKRVDCLRVALATYEKSQNNLAASLNTFQELPSNQPYIVGPFAELNQGAEISKDKSNEFRIHLKDIFNFGEIEEYDTSKHGGLRLHMEMNLDKIIADKNFSDPIFDLTYNGDGGQPKYSAFTNTLANGVGQNILVSDIEYDSITDCPFYNNMKCKVSYTGTVDAIARVVEVVQLDNKKVQLTFSNNIAVNGTNHPACVVEPVEPGANISISYNKIEIVAEYSAAASGPDGFEYTEYNVIEDNFPAGTSLNRNYHLHPNCVNAWILFPNPIYSTEPITSYRLSIDNETITNRDVVMGGPVHRDLIGKVFMNNGRKLKNMNELIRERTAAIEAPVINAGTQVVSSAAAQTAIACPVPLGDGKSRMLGIELTASAAMGGKISIYQEVVKKL